MPYDTSKAPAVENLFVAAAPGGIERQEAQGQADLTSRFRELPTDGMSRYKDALIRLGFTIGEPNQADPIFTAVTAPKGWQLKPTDHSMHSDILDAASRRRGGVFYKAAFYDRSAHFSLSTRYCVDMEFAKREHPSDLRMVIRDRATGEAIETKPWRAHDAYAQTDIDRDELIAEMTKRFPDSDNVEAYWND
jgi:hypothetical protein